MFFGKEVKIKFLNEFTSPVLGNIYIGKIIKVKPSVAQKWIALGHAEIVEQKISVPEPEKERPFVRRGRQSKAVVEQEEVADADNAE